MKLLFINSLKGLKNKKIQMFGIIVMVLLSIAVYVGMNTAIDTLEDKYYSYSINYYSNSYDQFDTINALVDNIKKSRRFDSEYGVIDKIKIYANEENIQKIKYNNEVS